jgi:hypothetical protein
MKTQEIEKYGENFVLFDKRNPIEICLGDKHTVTQT